MDYDGKRCQYKEQVRGLQEQRENFSQSVDQKILDFFLQLEKSAMPSFMRICLYIL